MTTADMPTFVLSVDRVLVEDLDNSLDMFGSHWLRADSELEQPLATMLSDKMIQCDRNVELWEAALHATLRDITTQTYPHYLAIQSLFNYTLNCHKYTDFGLVSAVMSQLQHNHPAGVKPMSKYYQRILTEKFGKVYGEKAEDEFFFWLVVDLVKNSVADAEITYEPYPPEISDPGDNTLDTLIMLSGKTKQKPITFYKDLSLEEQRKRSTLCLRFLSDILEEDFSAWKKCLQKGLKPKWRCLLSRILWPDAANEGYVNQNVQKIITLQEEWVSHEGQSLPASENLLLITAELIRSCDQRKKIPYPFFGEHTQDFARKFSSWLIEHQVTEKLIDYLQRVNLPWLRLLASCQVLSNLAGTQFQPELYSASTIMEHFEYAYKIRRQGDRRLATEPRPPANPELILKFTKLKSVNTCFRNGTTRLQKACYDDNIEEVRALLTFPLLDLNQTDASGWTALHIAARRGSVTCVEELLAYVPPIEGVQRRVNTRARGPGNYTPLMCAVEAGQESVCLELLKHTGWVLLEDITDDNQTAMGLTNDQKILRVLRDFKERKVETIYSRKELYLNTGNLPLVARLCTEFIQSYLTVHCTWKVYHKMKELSRENQTPNSMKLNPLFEYSRYHRDLRTNLPKIRKLAMKLKKIPDLTSSTTTLVAIAFLNKA